MPKNPSPEASVTLQVEMVPIAKVKPYAGNAKIHPDPQIGEISASIDQFGFVSPILIDRKGEIIAGHGRLAAAQKRKMKEVPVIRLGHLTDAQVKALRIADNSIGISGTSWNPDLLESELAALRAQDFELTPLGLDNIELPDLDEGVPAPPSRGNRSKSTIFCSVLNQDYEKARKVMAAALDKAKIGHNL